MTATQTPSENHLHEHVSRMLVVAALAVAGGLSACSPSTSSSASSPVLGTAAAFAVLGGQTVTNTGATTIVGDLGVSPGLAVTGFPPGMVTGGVIHPGDAVALQAQADVVTAYDVLAGQACTRDLTGQDLGGLTLVPGVYCFSSSAQLTGTLTLDGGGDPDAVFVFQIGSTLTTASNSSVLVIDGAKGCNVFWQVGSSATVGTTSHVVGSILALTSISLTNGAQLRGRALARNGAVTMDDNHVELDTCTTGTEVDAGTDAHDECVVCGDRSVDLQTDHDNCGECGNVCSWDLQCIAGSCSCLATTCGDICVNVAENPLNCGACDHACPADQWCDHGACTSVCAGEVCSGWCTDLTSNHDACGACGHECGAAEVCSGGACVCTGTTCGGACVDVGSSVTNCGSCGHACAADECCTNGVCGEIPQ